MQHIKGMKKKEKKKKNKSEAEQIPGSERNHFLSIINVKDSCNNEIVKVSSFPVFSFGEVA